MPVLSKITWFPVILCYLTFDKSFDFFNLSFLLWKWGGGRGEDGGYEQAFIEEEPQVAKKCMERYLTSLTIKEMQMQTTMRTSKVLFASPSRVLPLGWCRLLASISWWDLDILNQMCVPQTLLGASNLSSPDDFSKCLRVDIAYSFKPIPSTCMEGVERWSAGKEMQSSLASSASFQGKPYSEDRDPVPNRTAFFICSLIYHLSFTVSMRTGTSSVVFTIFSVCT